MYGHEMKCFKRVPKTELNVVAITFAACGNAFTLFIKGGHFVGLELDLLLQMWIEKDVATKI